MLELEVMPERGLTNGQLELTLGKLIRHYVYISTVYVRNERSLEPATSSSEGQIIMLAKK